MEFLQQILDSSDAPYLIAFILGLMTAISPCPMATNITAIAYISKDIDKRKKIFVNGLIYTAGRAFTYTLLGLILFFGASKFHVSKAILANGEKYLGFLLIIIGVLMLDFIKIGLPSLSGLANKTANKAKLSSGLTAFLLGVIFSLAFCPYGGVLYFGMLIPITITSVKGLYLPLIYAIATGLPVIIVAYLLAFTISGVGYFYQKLKNFEIWFRRIISFVFIIVGFYYIYIFYIK